MDEPSGVVAGGEAGSVTLSWLNKSRQWANEASRRAGVPAPLSLLPSAPILFNPAWHRAPSFSAAATLVALSDAGCLAAENGSPPLNGRQQSPGVTTHRAAASIASQAGWLNRALWLAGAHDLFFAYTTPYTHLSGLQHRQHQLLPLVVQLLAGQPQKDSTVGGSSNTAAPEQAQLRQPQASRVYHEIAADQRPFGLRLMGWILSHTFRWLFNSEVYVDLFGTSRLRSLYQQQQAVYIYIPAHKSHLDYLMLSYVLFACGLPCPHIAAGANLSLPLVGRLLRSCGAFFIRRTSRGMPDSELYKSVLAAYVHALLVAGLPLEFFIEGGRSRDGRVNTPKLGMLRMVVDGVMAGDVVKPVYLVPTAMNYDLLLEENSLAAQLAGAPKKSESLLGLASTCWGILLKAVRVRWQRWALGVGAGGYCGRATVAFGAPLDLQQWLQDNKGELQAGGAAQRRAVAALGDLVTAGIRTASVLPTSALLVAALFAELHCGLQRGGSTDCCASADAVISAMDWLAGELEMRGAAVVRLPLGDTSSQQQDLLLHMAAMLPRCCCLMPAASRGSNSGQHQLVLRLERGIEAALLQHSRLNQLLPWFAAEGLLAAAVLAAGRGCSVDDLLENAAFLRCLLAPEIDTALGPHALSAAAQFQPVLQRLLASGVLVQAGSHVRLADADSSSRRATLFAATLLAPLLATYLHTLQAMQAVLANETAGGISSKALCTGAQEQLLQLAASSASCVDASSSSSRAASLVVPSVALVQGALRSFAAAGVLAAVPSAPAADLPAKQQPCGPQPSAAARVSAPPSGKSRAVDEEYSVQLPAQCMSGTGRPPRRSLERRRPSPAAVHAGNHSGSDSDQDPAPVADSVAANLCTMDSSSSSGTGSSVSSGAHAASPALPAAADGQQRWVLAQPPTMIAALIARVESFICF